MAIEEEKTMQIRQFIITLQIFLNVHSLCDYSADWRDDTEE